MVYSSIMGTREVLLQGGGIVFACFMCDHFSEVKLIHVNIPFVFIFVYR